MKEGTYQFLLASSISLCCLVTTSPTQSQIVPDTTLTINSTVNTVDRINIINGGTRVGNNLFHSFELFSVPTGNTAFFSNTSNVQNIFSRVTGSSISKIDGLIQTEGTANLFLLNPNGIIFGSNARLKIGGSFLASTASSLNFADDIHFSATTPQNKPLLSMSVPTGLQYGVNVGNIQVKGSNLEVSTGNTLALVGGDVKIDGGILQAPGGHVDLGAVGAGTVELSREDNYLRLSFPNGLGRADVSVTNRASINVMTEFPSEFPLTNLNTIQLGSSGSITVNARNLNISDGSNFYTGIIEVNPVTLASIAITKGINLNVLTDDIDQINRAIQFIRDVTGPEFRSLFTGVGGLDLDGIPPGNITLNATENLTIEQSSITSAIGVYAPGHGSSIKIQAENLAITNNAQIFTNSEGYGNAGNIYLQANELGISDSNIYSKVGGVQRAGVGDSGDITIQAQSLSLSDNAKLELSHNGVGNIGNINILVRNTGNFNNSRINISINSFGSANSTGNINIDAGSISLTNGTYLRTFVGDPNPLPVNRFSPQISNRGNVSISVRDTLYLANSEISSDFFGGRDLINAIRINARSLFLTDDARISTFVSFGSVTAAGNIEINATDTVSISKSSGISTSYSSGGRSGNISVDTRELRLSDEAILNAATNAAYSEVSGGNITVNAETFEVTNGSQLVTTALGNGNAGDISLNVADRITVEGAKSGLFTNTDQDSTGAGGNLIINTGQLFLRQGGQASASSDGTGAAGNLQVTARSLQLDNSGLSATTTAGDRGNITIQSQNLQMRHNSNISTNASNTANGGNITIDTEVLAALEDSDIRANAVRGDGGRVNITAQGVFGTEYRAAETSESDITASSTFGRQGEVTLNTPDVDPSRGLIALTDIPVDPTRLVAQGCPADKTSRFSITGRGGLPPNPSEALGTDGVVVNWVTLEPKSENISTSAISTSATRSTPTPSIEAQGFQRNANGDVLLTATSPTVTPYSSLSTPVSCHER